MLKIGDFAKVFNVTIKTIRFYEEKELIKPAYIDKYSGYRYYDDSNFTQMSKIMYLKNLGFSLEEIKNYNEKLIKDKILEYEQKIKDYKANINILKEIEVQTNKGEEVKAFINDEEAIGKWNLVGVSTNKENARKHIYEDEKYFDIKKLYLMENGRKYWIISWSKGVIYIKDKENPYEIDDKYMYVEILYPEDKSVYMVAVYEKENNKKYEEDEIGKRDFFNGYYVNDYKIMGFWKAIQYLPKDKKFNYRNIDINIDMNLKLTQLIINPEENEVIAHINNETKILKYTKNYILDLVVKDTKCKYEYKKVNGKEYLFLEWKDEDYIYNNKIEKYYILEKIGGINHMEKMFEKEEKVYSILSKDGTGLTLGKNLILPKNKRGNTNALVIGGSGSGKSASYTVPNLLKMLGSYIVIDVFGEIYDKTHKFLKKNGYKVKVINYKNIKLQNQLVDEEDKYNYNPLKFIKNGQDIENLASILTGYEADEFWNEACKSLIKSVIYYVIENEDKKDLYTCFNLISKTREELFERFNNFKENSKGAKYYAILKTFPEKTYQSIVSTAIMRLAFVINLENDELQNNEKFDLTDIINEKVVIFLVASENHIEEKKIINIFLGQFLASYTLDKVQNNHIYMLLDEIDQFGAIYNMARNTEISRTRKLSISYITSNLERLRNIYGNDFYSIINSIDTQILLGTNVKSDIEYFSDLLDLDYEFIKNDLGNDRLLVSEKGLKAVVAEKDYFFTNEEWMKELEKSNK